MTKTDLETILLKIRNRCGLEEQSKITYYWDDEGRIVFKIFFDSLYLPEELRVGEDNIQNMFLTQNTYAYKDEFQIIELNQDEGFIKILPDDQDFIVIDSYKASKQNDEESKKDKEKEESVKLAGRRLNEDFALMKGYLLQEDGEMSISDMKQNTEGSAVTKAEDKAEGKKEPKDIHAYVAVINNPIQSGAGKATTEKLINPLRDIPPRGKDGALSKLFIGVPDTPAGNKLNSYNAYSVARLNDVVLEATGKAVGGVYLLCSQNSKAAEQVLAASNVIDVTYLTDESAAKELLKSVNAQQLLSAPEAKSVKNELVQDTTSLAQVEQDADKIIKKYRDMVQTYGGVRKDPSQKTFVSTKSKAKKESETKETTPKTSASVGNTPNRKSTFDKGKTKETKNWDKAKENLAAAIKSDPNVDAAIKLLCDLCPDSMDGEDKRVYESRKKEYGAAWAVLGPLGRPLTGLYDSLKAHCSGFISGTLLNALSAGASTARDRAVDELTGQEANETGQSTKATSMVSNIPSNQASNSANVSLTYKGPKKGETPKDTSERISDYTNDFPVFCAYWQDTKKSINPDGKYNSLFEALLSQIDVSGVKDAKNLADQGAQEVGAKAENKQEEPKNDAEQEQPNDEAAEQENDVGATPENDTPAESGNEEAASNGEDK